MKREVIEQKVKALRGRKKMKKRVKRGSEVRVAGRVQGERLRPSVKPTHMPVMGLNVPMDNPQFLAQGQLYHLNQRPDQIEDEVVDRDIFDEGIERESNYGMLFELGQDAPPQPSRVDNKPYTLYNRGGGAVPSANWLRGNGYALNSTSKSGGTAYSNGKLNKWLYGSIQEQQQRFNFIGGADGRNSLSVSVGAVQRAERNKEIEKSIENIKGRRNRDNEEYIHNVESVENSMGYASNGHNVPEVPVSLGVSVSGFQDAHPYVEREMMATNERVLSIDHRAIFSH